MPWKEAKPEYPETLSFAKLNVGTIIEGHYLGVKSIKANGRTSNVYSFENGNGRTEVYGVGALDTRMPQVPLGAYTRLEYRGKVRGSNGQDRHDVLVQFDENNIQTPT